MNRISVVIVSFNAPLFLHMCLESVYASLNDIEGEIVVVDNDSSEDCASMIRENFPGARLIVNKDNVGFSRAANQGAEVAQGDYLLILNPDVVLPEDGLKKVLTYAQDHPDMGALGCRFINGTGELLPECKRNLPGIRAATSKLFGFDWGYYANDLEEKETGDVAVLTGAFMFLKRELYEKAGGFDERFFMFGEDIDLSYLIHKSGHTNRFLGSLTIIHFKGESSAKDATYLKHFYGALEIFYGKHYRHHALGRMLLRLIVQIAIGLRSLGGGEVDVQSEELKTPAGSVLYFGEREGVYEALKYRFGTQRIRKISNLDEALSTSADIIFFDSSSLSFATIINAIDLLPNSISKRIVSRKGDFYLGSDSSRNRGVSERLQR